MTRPGVLPVEPVTDSQSAFAFLLGILFNQQMRGTLAWQAPHELAKRIGGLRPEAILALGQPEFRARFAAPPAIHPFTSTMADKAFEMARMVVEEYGGDARNIWSPTMSAGELVTRLMAFPGIGEHKARIALFVATVELGIAVRGGEGDYSIRSCGSLAAMFYPLHEPVFTTQ